MPPNVHAMASTATATHCEEERISSMISSRETLCLHVKEFEKLDIAVSHDALLV